jgi:trehalose/maltose hydrolase-like predicted phosphorylase
MAGTVDLVQRGHTGIVTREGVLWFNPCLPEEWVKLRMRLRYREQSLEVEVGRTKLIVHSIAGPEKPIRVGYREKVRKLGGGEAVEFNLAGAGCKAA